MGKVKTRLWLGILAACCATASMADAARQASPRFPIVSFQIEGNTLLDESLVQGRVAPFIGPRREFADVQQALAALEAAYRDAGWGSVQVVLPEQALDRGIIRFRVIEGKIGSIAVEGAKHFDEDNIRASLPGLKVGAAPRPGELQASLRLANENPAKQTALVLRAGKNEGELDATLRVADQKPARWSVGLDNSGTPTSGDYRLGVGYQDANFLGRDHLLNVQAMTSPTKMDKVLMTGVGYRMPIYALGDSIDLAAGYSDSNSGTIQELFTVSGAGTIYAARYNKNLPRLGNWEPRLSLGGDYREYRNNVRIVGSDTSIIPDITVRPLSLSYQVASRAEGSDTALSLSYVKNLPGGNRGDQAAFSAARYGADAGYSLWRWSASHQGTIAGSWQWRVAANGQQTRDALVPGEQFGLGGTDSIRGFRERELANDRGIRGSMELYTPDLGHMVGIGGVRLRALTFYDAGRLWRNKALPGELTDKTVASYGVGLRANLSAQMSLRLDYGVVAEPGGNQGRNDGRLHAGFAYQF
jgi:hemolysin activation/secretion protein